MKVGMKTGRKTGAVVTVKQGLLVSKGHTFLM